MKTSDLLRIIGYVAGLGTLVTGQIITQILSAFYVPQPYITVTISVAGGIITLATLIYSVVTKAVPAGYTPVLTPEATPQADTLTTKAAVKASAP